jgi:hypothetical protein
VRFRRTTVALLALVFGLGAHALAQTAARVVPMTAAQMIAPPDLTSVEANFYKTLDEAAAKEFLITRSWFRLCVQVIKHNLPALQLPDKPAGFNVKYLLPTDPNYINRAMGMRLAEETSPNLPPLVPEMSPAQTLAPSALTLNEQAKYQMLADPAQRKNFIETRSYIRLCRAVLDHKMAAAKLPLTPLGYDPAYLFEEGDNKAAADAQKLLLQALTPQSTLLK